jgi:23S rRNA (adenine2503-C2)-methyltransferase
MLIAEKDGKKDLRSMLPEEIGEYLASIGEKSFRAGQIFKWVSAGAKGFDEMSNLSLKLREKLSEDFFLDMPTIAKKQVSAADGTVKYLWRLADGNAVESVLMKYEYGNSICVSSQVGCRMGCVFCASTGCGLVRNLLPSEILAQVLSTELDSGEKVSHIVMMGIGEPFDNFDNVMRFLRLVNHPEGLNIGMRHISLSTCGLIDEIDKMASFNLQLTLSVSLHAPDDETRNRIMPANRRCGVDSLMSACSRYYEKTGRRISFEYALIAGVNDSDEQARLLAKRVKPLAAHVNIIPLNNIEGSPLKPGNARAFAKKLTQLGVNATVRRRLGSDIDAACGQLRRKTAEKDG